MSFSSTPTRRTQSRGRTETVSPPGSTSKSLTPAAVNRRPSMLKSVQSEPVDAVVKRPLEWTQYDSSHPPEKRSGHSMVQYGNKFFIFGGMTSIVALNDMWSLEPIGTRALWNKIELNPDASPSRRSGHATIVVGSKMYIFGGDNLQGCLDDVWAFDLEAHTWEQFHPAGVKPAPRYGHTWIQFGNSLLLFGGADRHIMREEHRGKTDVVFYADLWYYHIDRNEWEQLFPTVAATVPCKRYGHSFTVVDNRAYLYGGFVTEGLTSARLNDLWELNPETLQWREVQYSGGIAPPKLMQHTAVACGDQLVVFGGVSSNAYASGNIFVFDCRTLSWNIGNPINSPPSRSAHGCVLKGNDMFIFGGANDSKATLNDVWSMAADLLIRAPSRMQQLLNAVEMLFTHLTALKMSLRTDRGEAILQSRWQHPQVRWDHAIQEARELLETNVAFIEMVVQPLRERLSAHDTQLQTAVDQAEKASLAVVQLPSMLARQETTHTDTSLLKEKVGVLQQIVADLRDKIKFAHEEEERRVSDYAIQFQNLHTFTQSMSETTSSRFLAMEDRLHVNKQAAEQTSAQLLEAMKLLATPEMVEEHVTQLRSAVEVIQREVAVIMGQRIDDVSARIDTGLAGEVAARKEAILAIQSQIDNMTHKEAVQKVAEAVEQQQTAVAEKHEALKTDIANAEATLRDLHAAVQKTVEEHHDKHSARIDEVGKKLDGFASKDLLSEQVTAIKAELSTAHADKHAQLEKKLKELNDDTQEQLTAEHNQWREAVDGIQRDLKKAGTQDGLDSLRKSLEALESDTQKREDALKSALAKSEEELKQLHAKLEEEMKMAHETIVEDAKTRVQVESEKISQKMEESVAQQKSLREDHSSLVERVIALEASHAALSKRLEELSTSYQTAIETLTKTQQEYTQNAVAEAIKSLKEEISTAQSSSQQDLQNELTEIRAQLASKHEETQKQLESQNQVLQTQATEQQSSIATMQESMKELLKGHTGDISARLEAIDVKVAGVSEKAATEASRVESLVGNGLADVRNDLTDRISKIDTRIQGVESQWTSQLNANTETARLTSESLSQQIAQLQLALDTLNTQNSTEHEHIHKEIGRVSTTLTSDLENNSKATDSKFALSSASTKEMHSLVNTRLTAFERQLLDTQHAVPAIDTMASALRAELADAMLVAQKHADTVRAEMQTRTEKLVLAVKAVTQLPADVAAINKRLTEAEQRIPVDQDHIAARETLQQSLTLRLDQLESKNKELVSSAIASVSDSMTLTKQRVDGLDTVLQARIAAAESFMRTRAETLQAAVSSLQSSAPSASNGTTVTVTSKEVEVQQASSSAKIEMPIVVSALNEQLAARLEAVEKYIAASRTAVISTPAPVVVVPINVVASIETSVETS